MRGVCRVVSSSISFIFCFVSFVDALPEWKKMLIQKSYTSYPNSLAMEIDAKRTIFIAIDGTKTDTTSGGGWLISTTTGKLTAHGGKPIFGNNDSMHLHRSEIYVALALFTFLSEYCKYYQITNNSVNVLYCDNEEVVKKLKAIIKNKQTYLHEYRMSEHEAILALIPILTTHYKT